MTNYLTISKINGIDGSNAEEVTSLVTLEVHKPYAIPSITSRMYVYYEGLGLKVLGNPMPVTIYGDAPTQKIKGRRVDIPSFFSSDATPALEGISISTGTLTTTGSSSEFNSPYTGTNPNRLYISGSTYVVSMEDGTLIIDGTVSTDYNFVVQLTSGRVLLSGPAKSAVLNEGVIQFEKVGTLFTEGFSFRTVVTSGGIVQDFFFHRGSLYKISHNNIILLQSVLPDATYYLAALPISDNFYLEGVAMPYVIVRSATHYYELYFNQELEQFNAVGNQTNPNMYISLATKFTYINNGTWASSYNDNSYVYINRVTSTNAGSVNSFTTFDDAKADMTDRLSGTSTSQRQFFGADGKDKAKLFYIRQGNFKIDTFQFGGLEDVPALAGASSTSVVPFDATGLTIVDHLSYKFPYSTNSGYTQSVVAFFRLSNGAIVGVTGEDTDQYFFLPSFCSMPVVFQSAGAFVFLYYDARMNTLIRTSETFAT